MNNGGKSIDSMNFEELRSYVKKLASNVQELSDLYAKTKREYNDMLYNLSRENISLEFINEQEEFVNSTVGDKLEGYSTIEQTRDEIKTSVGKTMEYVDERLGNEYTTIKQTAQAITQTAYRGIDLSKAIEIPKVTDLPEEDDGNEYFISHDGFGSNSERTYYAYNDALGKYMPILDGQSIYTVFEQTTEGFVFKGNVVIDGDLCVLRNIRADRLYSRDYPNGYYMKIYGEFGDFGIFSPDAAENGNFSQGCILGAYNNLAEAILVINSQNVMAVDSDEVRAMNKKWNFSGVDVEGLGVVPVFG